MHDYVACSKLDHSGWVDGLSPPQVASRTQQHDRRSASGPHRRHEQIAANHGPGICFYRDGAEAITKDLPKRLTRMRADPGRRVEHSVAFDFDEHPHGYRPVARHVVAERHRRRRVGPRPGGRRGRRADRTALRIRLQGPVEHRTTAGNGRARALCQGASTPIRASIGAEGRSI